MSYVRVKFGCLSCDLRFFQLCFKAHDKRMAREFARDGEGFTLSLGERDGVRASLLPIPLRTATSFLVEAHHLMQLLLQFQLRIGREQRPVTGTPGYGAFLAPARQIHSKSLLDKHTRPIYKQATNNQTAISRLA